RFIVIAACFLCFFFSSRRRHTRWPRDWSSDVCSSDLNILNHVNFVNPFGGPGGAGTSNDINPSKAGPTGTGLGYVINTPDAASRSEERRVGKECRPRGGEER